MMYMVVLHKFQLLFGQRDYFNVISVDIKV